MSSTPVVVSAIVDALRDYGVRDIKMPATPYNIWRTIQGAKTTKDAKASPDAHNDDIGFRVVRVLLH